MKLFLFPYILVFALYGANVHDMLDRNVQFEKSQKIVALGPGALRLVLYMELEARLCGIERIELKASSHAPYRMRLSEAQKKKLPIVAQGGAGKLPNFEALLAAKPDLIITSFLSREQIDLIEAKTKIPVVALSYGSSYGGRGEEQKFDAIARSLELLGAITHHEKRAQTLIDFMNAQQKRLLALHLQGKSAYIAGLGYKGAQGITSTEHDYLPFEILGMHNAVASQGKGHQFVKEEAILSAKPKHIFVDALGAAIVAQERRDKPFLFKLLEHQGTIHPLRASNFYNANIENLFVNAWVIAKEMGANVDVAHEEDVIYNTFLGENATKQLVHP